MRAWGLAGVLLLSSCGETPTAASPQDAPRRPLWNDSKVAGSPDPPLPFRAARAFPKLKFKNSLYMAGEPGTDRLMVVEQHGKVHAFRNDPAVEKADLFLELKDWTFYSIMFHPRYAENRWVYVFANGPASVESPGKKNRILRYEVRREPPFNVDPKTERLVIEWTSNGHDGGEMAFGPDGMLYISAGDGTTDSDTNVTGQDIRDLNSGMIRIDVEHPDPGKSYSIPKDNPFLGIEGARPELWAFGFRNPWRMCFDPRTGDLWVGDIGQDIWEMVHVVQRGANYGWSVYEGGHPFYLTRKLGPAPYVKPTIAHHHSEARSITGGLVYTGPKYKDLDGAYLYGDYSTGRVWAARTKDGKIAWHREIADTPYSILGFCQDPAGEIYLATYNEGEVYRLEPSPPEKPTDFPRALSASGVFTSVAGHRVHPALIPYSVNSPLWSDGAHKERYLGLPGDATVELTEKDAWKFPEGTVLVKTFSLDLEAGRRRIETRFLTLQQNEWVGYSYAWNDSGTDGTLVGKEGMQKTYRVKDASAPGGAREQTWYYPSRSDCMVCHSRASGFVLGLSTVQMNRTCDYATGPENQIRHLERLGVFKVNLIDHVGPSEGPREKLAEWLDGRRKGRDAKAPIPLSPHLAVLAFDGLAPVPAAFHAAWAAMRRKVIDELQKHPRTTHVLAKRPSEYGRLADPSDATADLDARARSYLHANCSQCHVEAGGGNSAFDIHITTPREKTKIYGVKPLHDAFGIADPMIVAPGSPERSILLQRVSRRGPGQMPPLATSQVDPLARRLLAEWIAGLK